jgi:uncharacterized protein (DUF849 family)
MPSPEPRDRSHLPHPLAPYPPLIVNAALTGMIPRRATVPHVPVTEAQIVADAVACVVAGATILHLHAREDDEAPAWRRERYAGFVAAIRARCPGVVVCVSTSGREVADIDRRADVLELEGDARPDMASLTLGSLNFRTAASVNAPDTIVALATRMRERGIRPELEVFDLGMAALAADLLARGILEPPLYVNLLLGGPNTAPATAAALTALVATLPHGSTWAAAGLGGFQLPMNGMAVFMGGHVRTGLEDNPTLDAARAVPATNAALVARVAELAALAGRSLATVAQTRATLGLPAAAA